jgi:hypothetical protein
LIIKDLQDNNQWCYSNEFWTGTQESTILQKVLEMLIKLSIQFEFCQNEPERRSPKKIWTGTAFRLNSTTELFKNFLRNLWLSIYYQLFSLVNHYQPFLALKSRRISGINHLRRLINNPSDFSQIILYQNFCDSFQNQKWVITFKYQTV